MKIVSLNDAQKFINTFTEHEAIFNIAILRNVMIEPFVTALKYVFFQENQSIHVDLGGYDTIFQDVYTSDSILLSEKTQCILVVTYLKQLSPKLSDFFSSLSELEIREEKERILQELTNIFQGIRQKTKGKILWFAFENNVYPALGIAENNFYGQNAVINELNSDIYKILQSIENAYVINTNLCLMCLGKESYYDIRLWHLGRMPYSWNAFFLFAQETMKFMRPQMGKVKKCLVLDCDNTLWGGVVGEDGISGIQLGTSYPGSSYLDFQKQVLSLYHRGVILALCSKNNADDVWEVFEKHPSMLLQKKHIAAYQINWQDKVTNIRNIAEELNIGLDSLVFIDDSDFEINHVNQSLPMVDTVHIPQADCLRADTILMSYGKFDIPSFSQEDKDRGSMYASELQRKESLAKVTHINDYYKSLQMMVTIGFADEYSIPRIAQQTQKTNQFNLTTKRYTESDIFSFAQSPKYDVFYLSLEDRFGKSGIVGSCIIEYKDTDAVIDSLLLSCRVLGRKVEDVFLMSVLQYLQDKGMKQVIGQYFRTKKNEQVECFYPNFGFKLVEDSSTDCAIYLCELENFTIQFPDFFDLIDFIK